MQIRKTCNKCLIVGISNSILVHVLVAISVLYLIWWNFSGSSPATVGNRESYVTTSSSEYNIRYRNFEPTSANVDLLLNIRKLILFAVHELNKPLKNTGCIRWWANPLDLLSYDELSNFNNHTQHRIKFIIQPGNIIQLQVEIRQKQPPIKIDEVDLEIVSPFELLNVPSHFQNAACSNEALNEAIRKYCICGTHDKVSELEQETETIRKVWNLNDPELTTWDPSKSYMIEDYMNFTSYDWFLKSPGNSTREIRDLGYSTEYCGPKLQMLIMIKSAPRHFKTRQAIRETYGNHKILNQKGIKLVFLIGISNEALINSEVFREAEYWQDTIIPNFYESYNNLTLGTMAMYNWIQQTCGNGRNRNLTLPTHILKADDDTIINVDLALRLAKDNHNEAIIGSLMCRDPPNRDTGSKNYNPKYIYTADKYVGFVYGNTVLINPEIVPLILHISRTTPFIHLEDVYHTGILPRLLKINALHTPLITRVGLEPNACTTKITVSSFVKSSVDMRKQFLKLIEIVPAKCSIHSLNTKVMPLSDERLRYCYFE